MATAQQKKNRNVALIAAAFVGGMVALTFASAPLYDLFCRVTGFGGTTMRAERAPDASAIVERVVTVRFDANVSPDMPWDFVAIDRAIDIRIGDTGLALYTAHNTSSLPVRGTATFNVTPEKVGRYFSKVACFCFTDQALAPGQLVEMPVNFFIDPAFATDPYMADVTSITLSYTFFPVPDDGGTDLAAVTP